MCSNWTSRDHLGQLCGFIDEHAEVLEVHEHWGTWSFGGGTEAHPSPTQLSEMGRSWCSRNQVAVTQGPLAALRRDVGVGTPPRAPQVKAPKMTLEHTDLHLTQCRGPVGPAWLCDTRWHLMLFPAKLTHMSDAELMVTVQFPQSVRNSQAVEVCSS